MGQPFEPVYKVQDPNLGLWMTIYLIFHYELHPSGLLVCKSDVDRGDHEYPNVAFTPVPVLLQHIHEGSHKQCVTSAPFLLFHIQLLTETKFVFP